VQEVRVRVEVELSLDPGSHVARNVLVPDLGRLHHVAVAVEHGEILAGHDHPPRDVSDPTKSRPARAGDQGDRAPWARTPAKAGRGPRAVSTPSVASAVDIAARRAEDGSRKHSDRDRTREGVMTQPERYEDLILGSGAGGKLLAWHLARSGRRTAVVERRYIGGSHPNNARPPTKNEGGSSKVADLAPPRPEVRARRRLIP